MKGKKSINQSVGSGNRMEGTDARDTKQVRSRALRSWLCVKEQGEKVDWSDWSAQVWSMGREILLLTGKGVKDVWCKDKWSI